MTKYFVRINNEDEYNRAVELLKSKCEKFPTVDDYSKFCEVLWSDGAVIGTFSRYDSYVNSYGDFETELFLEDKKEEAEDLVEVSVPKFKVGDTIECISDEWDYITKGKHYDVLDSDKEDVYINADDGEVSWYPMEDFVLANDTKVVAEQLMQETIQEIDNLEQTFDNAMSSVKDKQQNVTDLLKSLTASDNCFITFEKGKMIVVDTTDYLPYNVDSVEEAIHVAQKIDDLRVIEDELKELRGE